MRKNLLSTVVVFAALALTACGGKVQPCKTHKWVQDESKQNIPATCSKEGTKYEKCSVCGEKRESPISKAAHTYGEWSNADGCAYCQPEEQVHTCFVCGVSETKMNTIVQHTWEKVDDVEAGDGGVAYELIRCTACQKTGLRVAATSATLNGSNKGGAPTGCIKLSNANETMTVAIKLAEAKTGTIFLRGVMDYWHDGNNDNQNKMYSSVKDSSHTANFSLTVNSTPVDMSKMLNVKFGQMFPEAAGETISSGNNSVTYSQMGDAKVGAVSLNAGLNTIVFTRIDSYNLAIHDFLVVFNA